MDADFFALVDKLVQGGGHIGVLVFIWIGMQASAHAKESVRILRAISSSLNDMRREQRTDLTLLKQSVENLATTQATMDRDLVRLTGAIRRG